MRIFHILVDHGQRLRSRGIAFGYGILKKKKKMDFSI